MCRRPERSGQTRPFRRFGTNVRNHKNLDRNIEVFAFLLTLPPLFFNSYLTLLTHPFNVPLHLKKTR